MAYCILLLKSNPITTQCQYGGQVPWPLVSFDSFFASPLLSFHMQDIITDILETDPDLCSHHRFHQYYDYCVKSLMTFGDSVVERLVAKKHYLLWARMLDKQDRNFKSMSNP